MVPLRELMLPFSSTEYVTAALPLPLPLEVTLIQVALLVAVQPQAALVLRSMLPVSALAVNDLEAEEIEYVQLTPAWVTLKL